MLAVSTENGQMVEVSIIIMRKLSLFGSMRKINSELSPCRRVLTSSQFSLDSQPLLLRLRRLLSLPMTSTLDISHPAQPILEQHSELQFTSSFQTSLKIRLNLMLLLISTMYKSEVSMASTLRLMMVSSISQIEEDLEDLRKTSYKTCMMVL